MHARGVHREPAPSPGRDRDRRQHAVGPARECAQRGDGVGRVARLAENAPAERNGGVGAQDRRDGIPAAAQARLCGRELGERHALDVGRRQFAGAFGLERLGILVVTREQQLAAHAELVSSWRRRGLCDAR